MASLFHFPELPVSNYHTHKTCPPCYCLFLSEELFALLCIPEPKRGGGNPIDNEKSENIVFVTGTILKFYLHYLLHHTNVFWLAK